MCHFLGLCESVRWEPSRCPSTDGFYTFTTFIIFICAQERTRLSARFDSVESKLRSALFGATRSAERVPRARLRVLSRHYKNIVARRMRRSRCFCAQERTRTSMPVRALPPQGSTSTNFATRAWVSVLLIFLRSSSFHEYGI